MHRFYRLKSIKEYTRKMTLHNDVNLERIVIATEEIREADLAFICAEAEMVSKIEAFQLMCDKLDHIVVFDKHFIDATDIFKHRFSGKYDSYKKDKRLLELHINKICFTSLCTGLLIGLYIGVGYRLKLPRE
jgi:hypothetical protein